MGIHYPNSATSVGVDVPTTVAVAAGSLVLAPANLVRAEGGFIVNNATRNLWVTFTGGAATIGNPSVLVPANGGNTDIPGAYTGSISGIWETGGSGSCVIHQISYV